MVQTLINIFCISFGIVSLAICEFKSSKYRSACMSINLGANQILHDSKKFRKEHTRLKNERDFFERQVRILHWNRPGRKENLIKLNRLIKERNIKYGIGGN